MQILEEEIFNIANKCSLERESSFHSACSTCQVKDSNKSELASHQISSLNTNKKTKIEQFIEIREENAHLFEKIKTFDFQIFDFFSKIDRKDALPFIVYDLITNLSGFNNYRLS